MLNEAIAIEVLSALHPLRVGDVLMALACLAYFFYDYKRGKSNKFL